MSELNLENFSDATALSQAIHSKEVSCKEVMQATLNRVAQLNPTYNAIVSLQAPEGLLQEANNDDILLAQGRSKGWLHGIPQAIKDLSPVAGLPLTMGSPLMKDFVAKSDSLMASRMRAAGAIFIGKTNTPEFGLGSHTFNEVFGVTRNAFDTSKSAGGSSGGAAVAIATRMLAIADGSDFMGSLRNPAAWANIYGMRPSQGRVPMWPATDIWTAQLGTEGPMARSVRDLAQLLQVQSGYDARSPLSLETTENFSEDLDAYTSTNAHTNANAKPLSSLRIAWLGDLNQYLPFEPGLLQSCEAALTRMQAAGVVVTPTAPLFNPEQTWTAWLAWRRWLVAARLKPFMANAKNHALIKPEALWEYEQSLGMSANQATEASAQRSQFYANMLEHFEHADVLAIPSTQVWPFDASSRWPQQIAGRAMDTYHRWMEVVIYATFAGLPSISVPVGFGNNPHVLSNPPNAAPLPVGLQLIGKPRGDRQLLQVARAFEYVLG